MKVLAGRMTSSPGRDPGGAQCQLQGVGAVGDADAVAGAEEPGVRLLEFGHGGAADERGPREDLLEPASTSSAISCLLCAQVNERDGSGHVRCRVIVRRRCSRCRLDAPAPGLRPRSRRRERRASTAAPIPTVASGAHPRAFPHAGVHAQVGRPPDPDAAAQRHAGGEGGEVLHLVVVGERHSRHHHHVAAEVIAGGQRDIAQQDAARADPAALRDPHGRVDHGRVAVAREPQAGEPGDTRSRPLPAPMQTTTTRPGSGGRG